MPRKYCRFDVSLLCPWSQRKLDAGYCICCILKEIRSAVTGKGMFTHPMFCTRLGESVKPLDEKFLTDMVERLETLLGDKAKPLQSSL